MVNMYLDYCSGMKMEELSRKYDLSKSAIQLKCKQITVEMFSRDGYFIHRNIEKIKNDIRLATKIINTCPRCGRELVEADETDQD